MVKKIKEIVYKPFKSIEDTYQTSQSTSYVKDQTTGKLFKTSGDNVRVKFNFPIPAQFSTAVFNFGSNYASNTENTIYTCPANKVFIILGLTGEISTNAATYGNSGQLRYNSGGMGYTLFEGFGSAAAGDCYAFSIPLASPFLLAAGETITCRTFNANIKISGSVFGYEINQAEYTQAILS